ncbi:PREDICTED: pericentrin [Elephantulus edwardii]|uniref:pericentrin n=1 Tax=Elephantulus edwardii TaxID=28737 RepID=UPI0003F0C0DF|nr:PREDICTED: pericentrin [Elephantulus edwardii]
MELKEEMELLKIENRNLHEKLQHEIHLREDAEKAKCSFIQDHQEEVKKSKEKIQLMKQEFKGKEEEWKAIREDLKLKAEEKLTLMLLELREKTESEKQAIIDKFELRETEMRQLQGEQAAQILELAKSLAEQQGRLQQLELGAAGDEPPRCSQCGPVTESWERTVLRLKEDCALQLMLAQNRFLTERKELTEKLASEHEAALHALREKHAGELQLLEDSHGQHIVSLRAELQAEHQAEMGALKAALESEQWTLLETHVAELQTRQVTELSTLQVKHLSNLDSLKSSYLSEIQTLRDEHRQVLKELQGDLEEQLRKKDSFHQMVLTQELEKLKLKHDEELQATKDSLRIEMSATHIENLKAMAAELQRAHQSEFESEKKVTLHENEQAQPPSQKEEVSLSLQLQEKEHHIQQLKEQITVLSKEVEECHLDLERLHQTRERENQEGTNLISMLKSDVDSSHNERNALQDSLRRLLSLFGETLRAAIAMRNQISERVGLCLDDIGATSHSGSVRSAAPALDETLSGLSTAPLDPDGTLLESAEASTVTEISSHVRESFFMCPEATLEYEQPVRKVYQSLRMAVNNLLEMALDSSKQLEEARQIHSYFEKEFNSKNEETAQVIRKQNELLECLSEESAAAARLTRELHTAQGLIEGFKEERAELQAALNQKEQSEESLVLELEQLKQRLLVAAHEQARLKEECTTLQSQKEALAADAQERESGLQKEVECLTKEQLETRKQSEKDQAALLSQLRVLESELEEQVSQHQACAQHVEEVAALKQQMASLDKHLRSQRQFMDEQAAEREHERDEFQQEIQRLEEQLRQVARPQATSAPDSPIELLQEKLREKSDRFNELAVKNELADRRLAVQQEEIQRLEVAVAEAGRRVTQLQEELEIQRKIGDELRQDKELLKKQQMDHLFLVSTLQTELEEVKCRVPPPNVPSRDTEAQPEVAPEVLLQHEREASAGCQALSPRGPGSCVSMMNQDPVLDLKEQLEEAKDNLANKNEEILHLTLKLDVQAHHSATSLRELQEENAHLKAVCNRSPEVEELKFIIENLQENQARLQKEKAEEIEQLHEVIERLQKELSSGGPMAPELNIRPAESLQTELEQGLLDVHEVATKDPKGPGPHVWVLQEELEAALVGKAALGQLLEERERGHRQALEALGQSLRAAEDAAARQLAGLKHSLALKESTVEALASRLAEFEGTLKEKDAVISEKELEINAMSMQRAARLAELKAVLAAVSGFRRALERQPWTEAAEPPELQVLQAQCAHLGRQLQTLSQRFLRCQREPGLHPVHGEGDARCRASRSEVTVETVHGDDSDRDSGRRPTPAVPHGQESHILEKDQQQPASSFKALEGAGPLGKDSVMSVLTDCQRQLASELLLVRDEVRLSREDHRGRLQRRGKGKEKPLEHYQLAKVDLLTQVKEFQERLGHLVHSMTAQDQEKMELQGSPPSSKASLQNNSERVEPFKSTLQAIDLSSWGSPEVVRKDSSLDPPPSLPLTPCPDTAGLHSLSSSILQVDDSGLLCYPVPTAKDKALLWAGYPLAVDTPLSTDHHHVERTAAEKDVEDFIITSFGSQENLRSSPLRIEGKSDESEKSDGSGFGDILNEGPERIETPTVSPTASPQKSAKSQLLPETMKEREVCAQQVQALLKMVCDESRHILALSEYQSSPSILGRGEPCAAPERVLAEGLGLMEAVPIPLGAPQKGQKDSSDICVDWRGVFLRAVQNAFEKEQRTLGVELQSRLGSCKPRNSTSLLSRLENVVQEQGVLQEPSEESFCLSDRSSLLSEIQALRAQLRMTHLQNQEKLQQLCAALTSAEARGSHQEHQLRRQVELLAYKVEQEKCIANGLQKTLSEEQEKASSVRKLLVLEQNAVKDLKSELCECKQENERLLKSLNDVQKEVLQLRSMLDSKEKDLEATRKELEARCRKEHALQSQLEEEQLQHLQKEGQSSRALEELRASLDKQHAQNNRLRVALKHEQTAKDNLHKELQIECSRCEALLAQERSKLSELQKSMEVEQGRSRELSEALAHERLLTEQLSQRVQEASLPQALLQKLGMEQARVAELQALLERTQQQAVHAQQQLEAEVQLRSEALKREKDVSSSLEAAVKALQTQKQELSYSLQKEREKPAQLQAELEQLQERLREQDAHKDRMRKRAEPRQSHADTEKWKKWQRDKERLRELELQRQRDEHKIEQLQRTVRDLKSKEDLRPVGGFGLNSLHSTGHAEGRLPLELSHLREQEEELEKTRQQLLCAAGLLSSFIRQAMNRTINDWTSSNEKTVTSLLQTLEELKTDLRASASSQKKTAAQLQMQLVDVLLKDNDSLTKVLNTVTQEKAELCKAVSKLEKVLKHHLQKGCTLNKPSRTAWKHERTALQGSLKHTDPGPGAPAGSEDGYTCSIKVEKLYLHYLRAESFRKALIYQKKYLLLLIGGFQDSEQETLSMIAHLGVFPSKADKKAMTSRPFTRFRTAVRVVIAILRLRFLVKKWQEVDRKGALPQSKAVRSGKRSISSSSLRSERSLDASQDPEQSLTEYIHHLEMIQQRLGGIPPDSTSKKSCHQKTHTRSPAEAAAPPALPAHARSRLEPVAQERAGRLREEVRSCSPRRCRSCPSRAPPVAAASRSGAGRMRRSRLKGAT